jgi:hypothetical protein
MKQKTTLTEFIEYLEGIKEINNIPNHVITTAKNYLTFEKNQIKRAYDDGLDEWINSADNYFNETYTQSSE